MSELTNKQIASLACANNRLEGLPVPDGYEEKLEDYLDGRITKEELHDCYISAKEAI